jgi:hypothetical protein
LALLTKCFGDEIWSEDFCRAQGIPAKWIEELADNFESGFDSDSQTIYVDDSVTNQYRGIRDVDLAIRLGESLGIDVQRAISTALQRRGIVQAIKEAVMDGE